MKNNPIQFRWYIKQLAPVALLSSILIFSNTGFFIGVILIIVSIANVLKNFFYFSIEIQGERLLVNELFRQPQTIFTNTLIQVIVRQSWLDKILGLKTLYLEFQNLEAEKKISSPIFGRTYKWSLGEYPGIWGNILIIPGIDSKVLPKIIHDIFLHSGKQLPIQEVAWGTPFYNQATKTSTLVWGSLLFLLALIFVIALIASKLRF